MTMMIVVAAGVPRAVAAAAAATVARVAGSGIPKAIPKPRVAVAADAKR
jgi:hypothetical protein